MGATQICPNLEKVRLWFQRLTALRYAVLCCAQVESDFTPLSLCQDTLRSACVCFNCQTTSIWSERYGDIGDVYARFLQAFAVCHWQQIGAHHESWRISLHVVHAVTTWQLPGVLADSPHWHGHTGEHMIYKPRSPVRKCHRHDLEDAKPFLDQIASDDVCEGKLKDYVPLQAVVDTHTHHSLLLVSSCT